MAFHSLDPVDREAHSIAELAESSPDRVTFRRDLLHRLNRLIGFDLASIHSSPDGLRIHLYALGFEKAALQEQIPRHMAEFDLREVVAVCSGRPVVDRDIFSTRRRDRLAMYHEQLRPHHVTTVTIAGWRSRFGVFGTLLARSGPGAQFSHDELSTLERLLPCIRSAEALLSAQGGTHEDRFDEWFESCARGIGLSPRERQVAWLHAKGLTKTDIADQLHVSPNTIRNQLSNIYRKAEVTNGRELIRTMTETGTHAWWHARRKSGQALDYPWLKFVRGEGVHANASLPEDQHPR
jgi:DNA-binding CsgD family transcriptional regulator